MPSFDAGQTGITPGVTITRPDTTEYAARTTVGFTEVPAGSGSFDFAHPDPGTLLKFTFDALIGGVTYYASVWDDGLTPQAAAQAAIVAEPATLTAAYDHAKADVLTPLQALDGKVDALNDFDPATQSVNVGAVGGTEVTGPDDLKADVSGLARVGDGPGDIDYTYRVLLDSDGDGIPDDPPVGIPGAVCMLTSDEAGAVRVGSPKVADSLGNVTWRGLVAGTYQVWREHPAYIFRDPVAVTVGDES